MLMNIAITLEWFGLIVFATTGALTASRKQMDIVGFALLATVTGVGGGTIRDVLLGSQSVFWVQQPTYIAVCVGVASVLFFTAHIPQSRLKLLLWLDAVGLALFAVTGADTALTAGAGNIVAIAMGVITATFGGMLRDLLGGEEPVLRRPEVYVTAALFSAAVFVACVAFGMPRSWALICGFTAGFSVRAAALHWGLTLPRYKQRPGR